MVELPPLCTGLLNGNNTCDYALQLLELRSLMSLIEEVLTLSRFIIAKTIRVFRILLLLWRREEKKTRINN